MADELDVVAAAAGAGEVDGSVGSHGGSALADTAVGDHLLRSVGDVVANHVALGAGSAGGPDRVVPAHLAGRKERTRTLHLREGAGRARREIEEEDPAIAVPVQAREQQPITGHAGPVLPLVGVDLPGRRAPVPVAQVEELQIRSPALELLVDEQVTVDVPVGSVCPRSVDLELRAPRERAAIDVVMTGVFLRVLLPCKEFVPSDRLVLTDVRPPQEKVWGRGPGLGYDRCQHGQDDKERREKDRRTLRV